MSISHLVKCPCFWLVILLNDLLDKKNTHTYTGMVFFLYIVYEYKTTAYNKESNVIINYMEEKWINILQDDKYQVSSF